MSKTGYTKSIMPPVANQNSLSQQLATYKELLDQDIDAYCDKLLADGLQQYGAYSRESLAAFCAVLRRGGKRLRGALTMNSYYMLGGADNQLALQAARAVEMAHAYILIIDDICDNSAIRRGGPAAHKLLADYHAAQGWHGNSAHFGEAVGMTAALAGAHLAMLQIGMLPVNDTIKLAAMNNLNEHFVTTVHGQFNDIFDEAIRDVDEAQVQRVMLWKTAYYSFLSPLQFGAILAGAEPTDLAYFEEYSMNIGLSYQITDDILGTFGNEFESGKSAQDDLTEGKITILISRALQKATPDQKQQLLAALGKPDLTGAEAEICQQIIEDTGALDYARRRAAQYAEKATLALESLPPTWGKQQRGFLRDLALHVTQRNA